MSDLGILAPIGHGGLTIGGVDLVSPGGGPYVAWTILDLSPAWDLPEMRGSSTLYPGVAGRRANTRRVDQTTYRFPTFHITGALDPDGTPNTNPAQGLKDNIEFLWEEVVNIDAVTQAAELEAPDGTLYEADVQAQIVLGDLTGPYDKPAVLFVTVPAGRFEATGS